MIHFHGGPVTPNDAAVALWTRRHAMVSFERTDQAALAFEICQTVRLDCGAFSKWRGDGSQVDIPAYADWVRSWERHPAFDHAIIPDAIDGDALENDKLLSRWLVSEHMNGIPVWHLHEDLGRLRYLVQCAQGRVYPAVALGSSGQWSRPGAPEWWARISEAMQVACDWEGRPLCKLHGLRMLSPAIFSHLPLAAADSCNIARNIRLGSKWTGAYAPVTPAQRALVLAERIEQHAAASHWSRRCGIEQNPELLG